MKKCLRQYFNIKRSTFVYNNSNQYNNSPILCNSFPKSGTHLLFQVLQNLPHKDWYNFLASIPSFPFKERSPEQISKYILKFVDQELVGAHIFYSAEIDKLIKEKNIVQYFIYRDPRDVVISEAFYLSTMNSWHALSKYYKKLNSLEDKIQFAILGNEFLQTRYDYPNIVERFNRYKGWLSSNSVLSLRYEDLIGSQKKLYIEKILEFYNERSDLSIDIDSYSDKIIKNLDPSKSHTFREGGSNKWEKYFASKNKTTFKEVAGNLLLDLQYEKDLNW